MARMEDADTKTSSNRWPRQVLEIHLFDSSDLIVAPLAGAETALTSLATEL